MYRIPMSQSRLSAYRSFTSPEIVHLSPTTSASAHLFPRERDTKKNKKRDRPIVKKKEPKKNRVYILQQQQQQNTRDSGEEVYNTGAAARAAVGVKACRARKRVEVRACVALPRSLRESGSPQQAR